MGQRLKSFCRGEKVVFRMQKHTAHPGPRATNVEPEPQGENYTYQVDKYWVIADISNDGTLLLQTRRGKQHRLLASDPRLRHAHWWERWLLGSRFPDLSSQTAGSAAQ